MTETSIHALNAAGVCNESPPLPAPDFAGESPKIWDAAAHGFWFDYIDEEAAAAFLDLTKRTLQAYRQRGNDQALHHQHPPCVPWRTVARNLPPGNGLSF